MRDDIIGEIFALLTNRVLGDNAKCRTSIVTIHKVLISMTFKRYENENSLKVRHFLPPQFILKDSKWNFTVSFKSTRDRFYRQRIVHDFVFNKLSYVFN